MRNSSYLTMSTKRQCQYCLRVGNLTRVQENCGLKEIWVLQTVCSSRLRLHSSKYIIVCLLTNFILKK